MKNLNSDKKVISEFGAEWSRYQYAEIDKDKLRENFQQYFDIFPFNTLNHESVGFDMGCGTGRWAQFIAPLVGTLNCIEPSQAILVAKRNLKEFNNVEFYQEITSNCSLSASSQDFGYCLGVLHHIPNTRSAIKDCAALLKRGAPFLIYVYYNFENKPLWFKLLWKVSDLIRIIVSKLPLPFKNLLTELIAFFVYLPFARIAAIFDRIGFNVTNFPLSDYRFKPYYQMRNDSLDRFGTRLEQRFSKDEIKSMLTEAGFGNIVFSSSTPYWCCLSYKL